MKLNSGQKQCLVIWSFFVLVLLAMGPGFYYYFKWLSYWWNLSP